MKLKKSLIAIIAIVAVCALSLCVFVGCNNNKEDEPVASTNAETIGTAVAAAASYMNGGIAGSAAEDEDAFEEGFNLDFDASASVSGLGTIVGGMVDTALNGVKPIIENALEPIIEKGVEAVQEFVGDSKVEVKTEESDKDGYNTKIVVTVTSVDPQTNAEVANDYVLYMNIKDGKDIESKEFNYDASINATINGEEVELFAFSGTAAYDADLGSVAFNFTLGTGIAGVDFTASATKDGNVVLEIGADAFDSFDASVSIEIGKLAEGKYGAIVTVEGSANLNLGVAVAANFKAVVNVAGAEIADGEEYSLDLNGSVAIDVKVTYGGTEYAFNGNAAINGQAKYDVANDDLAVGINGTVAFNYAQNQAE